MRGGHFELALLIKTGSLPVWSEYHPDSSEAFTRLLVNALRQERRSKLLGHLKDALLDAPDLKATAVQLPAEELERFLQYAEHAQGMSSYVLLVLLRYMLSASAQGELLRDTGLTEPALAAMLDRTKNVVSASVSVARQEKNPAPPDFSAQLGPGYERLSIESRHSLGLAWLLRDGDELTGRDLLRALIATSNQTEDRNVHSLLHSLRPQAQFAERLVTSLAQDKLAPPTLSSEFYRVFGVDLRVAGADAKVTDYDLLLALAESGQELLAQENITSEEIRTRWAEGF